jgi:hypothetical protein
MFFVFAVFFVFFVVAVRHRSPESQRPSELVLFLEPALVRGQQVAARDV